MGIAISRINNRLGTCLLPLFQTAKSSFRPFSSGPISQNENKNPAHVKTQNVAKNIPFFEVPRNFNSQFSFVAYFAGGIAALVSLIFYSIISKASAEELSKPKTDADVQMADEDDLYVGFQDKIESRRFTMVDADNKEYDFGSYFHGYGKGLVKGMNLHFRKTILDNGTQGTELTFKVNHVFLERLQHKLDELARLPLEEQQAFALRCKAQGIQIFQKMPYTVSKAYLRKKSAHLVVLEGLGSLMIGKNSCYNLKDQVKVTLPAGATLESFQQFLSLFELEDALKKSTSEDIERLKIGKLFRTFFPAEAHPIERSDSFFSLPLDQLKQKIIDTVPDMKDIFAEHTVTKIELLPGYVRYGVPVQKEVYALGGRALTTALTSTSAFHLNLGNDTLMHTSFTLFDKELGERELEMARKLERAELPPRAILEKLGLGDHIRGLNDELLEMLVNSLTFQPKMQETSEFADVELSDKQLNSVITVLRNGLLSKEMRDKNGMSGAGLDGSSAYKEGGAQSVYIQLLTNVDLAEKRKISSIRYSDMASVRLYISLEALNQGSYQYESDEDGARNNTYYIHRDNIMDFAKKVAEDPLDVDDHEIMIYDIVPPTYFGAMSVKTERVKQQIIARARECNLLQKDQDGKERYNGILVDEFISTEEHLSPELLKHCSEN